MTIAKQNMINASAPPINFQVQARDVLNEAQHTAVSTLLEQVEGKLSSRFRGTETAVKLQGYTLTVTNCPPPMASVVRAEMVGIRYHCELRGVKVDFSQEVAMGEANA